MINIQTNKQEFLNSHLLQFKNELKDLSGRNSFKFSKSVLDKNPSNQIQALLNIQQDPFAFRKNYKIVPI